MWTLIPGFVGVGVIIAGLLDRERPRFESGGLILMAISAMGFLIFGSAFGALFGYEFEFGMLWPLFLIGIGVITLISAIFSTTIRKLHFIDTFQIKGILPDG